MKKKLLDFTKVHYYRPTQSGMLPALRTRHNRGANFRSGESPDDDEDDEFEDDKKVEERKALLKKVAGVVEKKLEGRATKEEVSAIVKQLSSFDTIVDDKGKEQKVAFPITALREMADEKTGVMAKLVEQGLEIQKLKQNAERQIKDMSVRSQVEAWQTQHKDVIKRIMDGEKLTPPALELRVAASPMLVSTVNSGTSPYIGRVEVESGVTPILRFDNTFWDFLTKGRTGAPTYVWVNKTNPQGAAAFIGPGVAKPGISFELIADTSIAKKVAVSAKVGTELLQDIDGMTSFIEDEMRISLYEVVNDKVMTGVESNTVPAGIQTLSQNYAFYTTAAAIKTTNPTFVDAVRASIGALRSGKIKGVITGFINPVDAANMDMAKAVDSGVYILPPFTSADGKTIAGVRIIEDQNVDPGYLQIGFMHHYRIKIYKYFTLTWGWENDDFTKNLVTAVAETRFHQMFNEQYTGAFLYDTFENIITQITKA